MTGTPDTPDRPAGRSSLTPIAVQYQPAGAGALRCDVCGALVDDGRELDHTTFHGFLGGIFDALAVRLAQFEEALADARIALDARSVRELAPPPLNASPSVTAAPMIRRFGGATGRMIDAFLADTPVPAGHVRIVLDGTNDVVTPAAARLAELLALEPCGPIMRDSGPIVSEQRAYLTTLEAIHTAVNRHAAAAMTARPAAGVEAAGEVDLGEPTGSGVVRVRLEGDPDDVDLAVELAESTGYPLADVGDAYVNNRKGPRGHVRRYGVVNLHG